MIQREVYRLNAGEEYKTHVDIQPENRPQKMLLYTQTITDKSGKKKHIKHYRNVC